MDRYKLVTVMMPADPPLYTLIDIRTGLQPILISLWAEHLRQIARPNSAKSYLKDIAIFLEWCEEKHIDLSDKFSNLELPRPDELSSFIEEKLKYRKHGGEYKSSTINRRIISTREFIDVLNANALHVLTSPICIEALNFTYPRSALYPCSLKSFSQFRRESCLHASGAPPKQREET